MKQTPHPIAVEKTKIIATNHAKVPHKLYLNSRVYMIGVYYLQLLHLISIYACYWFVKPTKTLKMTQQENGWSHVINDQPLMLGADLKFDSVNRNETNWTMWKFS